MNKSGALLSDAERQQVSHEWNRTQPEYPKNVCIHELFEAQVKRTPEATAVVFGDERISYSELNRRANRWAHYLRAKGVKPERRVGICIERSVEMVVGLLAVLKAGGAYVLLDLSYPEERLRFILEDSAPVALLARNDLQDLLRGVDERVHVIDLNSELVKDLPETNLDRAETGIDPECLACVIYTSGSTGKPKGSEIPHRSIPGFFLGVDYVRFDEETVSLQHSSVSWDAMMLELWPALLKGGRSVLAYQRILSAEDVRKYVQEDGINTLWLTAAQFNAIVESDVRCLEGLKYLITGGEAASMRHIRRVKEELPELRVVNGYGPSECTVFSSCYVVPEELAEKVISLPIGKPIGDRRMYVLDAGMRAVPVGVAGEAFIGGASVARGYLRRPELTAERFVPDPYSEEGGGRLYRTGDLVRWLADGNLEFLGRNDDQVKIRGFRIELGEIAARLQEYPAVEEAVVVAREDTPGEKRLVAYYVMDAANDPLPTLAEDLVPKLRRWLEAKLPDYMVPALYVRMDRMPLTANGKLDRKSLPAPGADAYAAQAYEAPQGETERLLAEIWAELLRVNRVGRHDNFFTLGGHSLLAGRVATRIRQRLGVAMTLGDLFTHPVLADLAHSLKGATRAELPAIMRAERGQRLPLSFAQQRLWFLAQMKAASHAYHVPMGLHLKGELDVEALHRALDRIVARHEALRTTFVSIDGEPWQYIASAAESRFHLLEHDLRQHRNAKAELDRLMVEEATASFDLQAGPLIRGRLIRQSEDEFTLLITMHHIVSDGWSMGVFLNEVSKLYSAFSSGAEDPLPKLEIQYADYAIWERQWLEGEELQQQGEYWKKVLQNAPALLELPTDHARPAQQDYKGNSEELVLGRGLTEALKKLSWRQGATLYMTLLAGWAALLSRLSGQTEVVIGTPVANRERAEIEGLIGFFVNTLALRVNAGGGVTVKELLKRVKEVAVGGQQNHNLPFERVVEIVRPERSLAHHPLFQVTLGWQNMPEEPMMLPGVEARQLESIPYQPAKFDLTLDLQEIDGTIIGKLEYATALFESSTIKRYVGYFHRLLEGMIAGESEVIDRLSLLSDREREQVLYQWNDTEVGHPSNKLVHELFAEQVEMTPESPAVEYDGRQLTYRELNDEANRLAHYLQLLGVRPEARVAICVERGLEMIIGLMAILKAGGAYVPLDPAYPQERLQYMLKDSRPVALLTQPKVRERMGQVPAGIPTVDLTDAAWNSQVESNSEAVAPKPIAGDLAYVLYTSGSTGKPKGVMVSHQNLVSSTFARKLAYGNTGRFLLLSPISFDSSVAGIFGSLLNGGTLIIASDDLVRNPLRLNQEIQRLRVESLLCVPSLYRYLLESPVDGEQKSQLSWVIVAGEVCPPDLVAKSAQQYPQVELFNEYGPTEGTVWASMHHCTHPLSRQSVPIGRPIANTQVYILDAWGEPVPVGVAGELCIGGTGVTRGYLHRPELTAERFVPDPYAELAGARMYKTGDVGRWLADGTLEFVGRNDDQVKIRGFRIELGEITARLQEHPAVEEAAVVAREDSPGENRLVAYYRPASPHAFSDPESLLSDVRSFLREHLPEYMIPAAYVRLESLPLTPNGKLDRRALPAPNGDEYATRRYVPPQGDLETALAAIWAEVLKLKQVGRQDDFFALGGHSLLALRVMFRVNDCFQTELSVPSLLEHSVLMDFAQRLRSISGRPVEELEKIAKIWLKIHSMTPEELKAALAVH